MANYWLALTVNLGLDKTDPCEMKAHRQEETSLSPAWRA
jgi:hypothetical protein